MITQITRESRNKTMVAKRAPTENKTDVEGGRFISMQSDNFDIIINILVGIRRSLSNLVDIPGRKLDDYEYQKRLG